MFHERYLITFVYPELLSRLVYVLVVAIATQQYGSNQSLISVPLLLALHKATRSLVDLTLLITFISNNIIGARFDQYDLLCVGIIMLSLKTSALPLCASEVGTIFFSNGRNRIVVIIEDVLMMIDCYQLAQFPFKVRVQYSLCLRVESVDLLCLINIPSRTV